MRRRLYLIAVVLSSIMVAGLAAVAGAATGGSDRDSTVIPEGWQIPTFAPTTPAAAPPPAAPALTPAPAPAPAPAPEALRAPAPPTTPGLDLTVDVDVESEGFLAWAALDRASGEVAGSRNFDQTSSTESMIKVWIVADYLRRLDEAGQEPTEADLNDGERAIRDSHDGAAERLYRAGGGDQVIERMIDRCDLTDTEIYPGWWSRTEISARDTVRMGECVADGTGAGPQWTDWVLEQMTRVRGTTDPDDQPMSNGGEGGRWGIIDGLPDEVVDQGVAIKNGWTAIGRTSSWHMACLAITDDWVIGVVMRYPASESIDYGAQRCASVAEQLVHEPGPLLDLGGAIPSAG